MHQRPQDPVTGMPVARWAVECAAHEAFFMGYNRPKILKYIKDPATGTVISQQRVLDSHPGFSTNPDTIPLTYDEQITDKRFRETAQSQIDMMNALGTAVGNGLQIPREMMYFLQKGLPAETVRGLQATLVCPSGHDNPAGNAFCGTCGVSMSHQKAIEPVAEEAAPADDLSQLHPQTLKKLCRQRGLPDSGPKDQLIQRLAA